MARTKVNNNPRIWFKFQEKGDIVKGFLVGYKNGTGPFGDYQYLEIQTSDGLLNIKLTASLLNVSWADYLGSEIEVEYEGEEKNKKTGRVFKKFGVYTYSE